MSNRMRGFTLIEMMIVVVIIGILAAIAWPNYREYVVRSNRTAAQAAMMDIANRQRQFLLANRAYATKNDLINSGYVLPDDVGRNYDYAITVGSGAAPSFTITFTAMGSQTSDGNLTLNSEGAKTPPEKW